MTSIAFLKDCHSPVDELQKIEFDELSELLSKPRCGGKDGPAWMPADIRPGPRTAGRVRALSYLVLDVEANAEPVKDENGRPRRDEHGDIIKRVIGPEPPGVADMLTELALHGWRAFLHSSYSHATEHPRYRLVFDLARPLEPGELKPLGLHVAALLGILDCTDTKCLEPARLFYLPRIPQERLSLFRYGTTEGDPLPVDDMLPAARRLEAAAQHKPRRGGQTGNVIGAFNAAHDVGAILERHGYVAKRGNRWLWPGSTSGLPGVRILPESGRVYSSHAGDPLNDGHAHDAFDVWRILEHGGDVQTAVREAAKLLGMNPLESDSSSFERGDKGERGEKPRGCKDSGGRTWGEPGRIAGTFDKDEAKARARKALGGKDFIPPEYPVDALGEVLGPAAQSIAKNGQMAPAMAGQSLLGTAALLTQHHFNVVTLAGVKPLSAYELTVSESGDGKTTADNAALHPVRAWQRQQAAVYLELARYEETLGSKGKGASPGAPPLQPWIIGKDATVEGIRADFQKGRSSQGVFTSEGATLLAGYGMSKDNRQKTCAVFCGLWDDGELSVSRATTGRVQLYGRRLSAHWMIQPDAARDTLNDPVMASMGFWPRFLLAWPEPAPPRTAQPFEPDKCPAIGAAWARFTKLLEKRIPDDCSNLPLITFTANARKEVLYPAFERFERGAKIEGGAFQNIRPFALRATEHICRVAGILAVIDGTDSIDTDAARRALRLVNHSIETWRTLAGDREESEARAWALCLFDWLADHGGVASETAMLKQGPKRYGLRSASRRDAALSVLELACLIERQGATWNIRSVST